MKARLLLIALLLAGCSHPKPGESPSAPAPASASAPAASPAQQAANGIAWVEGDVDAAFAQARSSHRPILLYWGASWCPPCQQLKTTVFNRPDFITRTRLFVPVHLDGDETGAQKLGETFHVSGYPTMVVLDPEGHERMRIAGSMDLAQYATVLDVALADLQPVAELLDAALQGAALNEGQCRRLALNGWAVDEDLSDADFACRAAQLNAAAAHCPAQLASERARLVVIGAWFQSQAEATAVNAGGKPSATLLADIEAVASVLRDPPQAQSVGDALLYFRQDFFRAVKAAPNDQAWLALFVKAMDGLAIDPDYAVADQLLAIRAKIYALQGIDGKVPGATAAAALARLESALAGETQAYARSTILNSGIHIYKLLGHADRAYAVVQSEMTHSPAGYYSKQDLADIAESLGRKADALRWYAASYEDARGPATRFQWGQVYAEALLRLDAADTQRIGAVATQVLGELDGPDRIYRRARTRLAHLDRALRDWNSASHGAHAQLLVQLRSRMQQVCAKIPAAEAARGSCEAFLAGVAG